MKKMLFLDFDGVLHSTSTAEHLLFSKLDLLTEVISKNPCRIVISSSWRFHYDLDHIKSFLPTIQEFIVGTTGDALIGKWPRYNEIKQYLNRYDPWADWRALDDSFLEFPKGCPELILCHVKDGFTIKEKTLLENWIIKSI
jgi:hypothetical protein